MASQVPSRTNESFSDLAHRLVADGRELVGAEVRLYSEIARYRATKAAGGFAFLGAALVLVLGGFITLLVGLMLQLAELIGPALAGLVILLVTAGIAYFLVLQGKEKLAVLSGSPEEDAALAEGERRA